MISEQMKTERLEACRVCQAADLEVIDAGSDIARCRTCGYIFNNPRPSYEELVKFYSRPAQYDSWLRELPQRQIIWTRRLSKLRSTRKPGSLLDVGTGIGQFLNIARATYTEVYGTEVSPVAIRIAQEKYGLQLFQGTIDDLEWGDKKFDNVTLFHVLEHVPDPSATIAKCSSLLAENGILVIAVPNEVVSLRAIVRRKLTEAGLKKSQRLGKFGLPRITLSAESAEVHLSHFTPDVLDRLLKDAGFTVLKRTIDPYFIVTGIPRLRANIYYYFCLGLRYLTGRNFYDTSLTIARKNPLG
jgi:2-polyprenyl-3-methyl-5-hydroxy-6-metoxy-1,4-benzoquinol methylase